MFLPTQTVKVSSKNFMFPLRFARDMDDIDVKLVLILDLFIQQVSVLRNEIKEVSSGLMLVLNVITH